MLTRWTPLLLGTINSLRILRTNTNKCLDIKVLRRSMKPKKWPCSMIQTLRPLSTGDLREQSTLSRTKANVDHAGLSQPQLQSKVITLLSRESSWTSLNKNLLTVTNIPEVAWVASRVMPSDTPNPTSKKMNLTTHTSPTPASVTTTDTRVKWE